MKHFRFPSPKGHLGCRAWFPAGMRANAGLTSLSAKLHVALFMTDTVQISTAWASQRLHIRGVEYAIADTGTAGPAVLGPLT
jgi:hypothetical protein